MFQWIRAYGHGSTVAENIAIFYFMLLMIMGHIVLFSLFTAILLRNFQRSSKERKLILESDEEEEAENENKKNNDKKNKR